MHNLPTFTAIVPNIGTHSIEVGDDLNVVEYDEQHKSLNASRDCEDEVNEGWPIERPKAQISTCWGRWFIHWRYPICWVHEGNMSFDHRHIQNQSLHSSFDMNSIVFLIWFKFLTLLMSSSTITPFTCTYILKYFDVKNKLEIRSSSFGFSLCWCVLDFKFEINFQAHICYVRNGCSRVWTNMMYSGWLWTYSWARVVFWSSRGMVPYIGPGPFFWK